MANQPLKVFIDGLSGELIIRYAEAATPTAYLGTTAPRPFPVDYTYDILNLRRVVHRFEFWQSNDGISLNQLIKTWDIDVAKQELPANETYYYTVGGAAPYDPAPNQLQLRDPRLLGKTYRVFEKGTGHLRPVMDYTDRSDAGGGFDRYTGYEFVAGGEYMVEVDDKIVVDNSDTTTSTGGAGISDVIIANESNYQLDNTWYNKLIVGAYSTLGTGIIQVPALSTIPDGTHLKFSTHGSGSRYVKLQLNGSDTITFWGKARNWIYLGQNESLELLIKGGVGYVLDDKTGYAFVGQRIFGDVVAPNTLLRDGTVYGRAYAGRLIDWVLDLPSSQVIDFTVWEGGLVGFLWQHFYAYDPGTQRIHVPNSLNMYQRAVPDNATLPGTYQGDAVGPLQLQVLNGSGGSSTNPLSNTQGFAGMDSNTGYLDASVLIRSQATETRGKGELLLPLVRI